MVIEAVSPQIDSGRFPIKRVSGEGVVVTADIFADGHDVLSAVVKYRNPGTQKWAETPMQLLVNDRWKARFEVEGVGRAQYTIEAWINHFRSWRRDLEKKFAARMDVAIELQSGLKFFEEALPRAAGADKQELATAVASLSSSSGLPVSAKVSLALAPDLAEIVDRWSERHQVTRYAPELEITVDPSLAGFSAWYEMFPRSCAPEAGRHGTFKDCLEWLPRISKMGFDIIYLPPIHPIGRSFRKGPNNSLKVGPEDPGSPWAIGSAEGGHKSIHPELGTEADFDELVRAAHGHNLEIALDIAFQCSPDHPYVKEHPDWFKHRADGSIQYAENPPKKYQDIYPLDFGCEDWRGLWKELKSVFEFWIGKGVKVFRVDNPHTKPFAFWQWCIGELKARHPELIFLAEAFTRPKVMYRLARLGFTQSYNYFPWRNSRHELVEYFKELTQTDVREFFRPNLWPNTPDILTEYLQYGGRPAFVTRLILAATLGASYGVYGPPYEACESRPREPGSEEYLDSEKFQLRHWPHNAEGLGELMARVNAIRRENPALHSNASLRFHPTENDQLIAYSKHSEDLRNIVIVVVNLDPRHTQRGWLTLESKAWGLPPTGTYQAHELLTGERFLWSGARNYVELNPVFVPAHIVRLRRYVRTEQDFDYFI